MSYVEVETGRYIKRWAFWNPATWSIPKLYWDAWSQEQRLHAICKQLEKVIKYADYLGVNVDDIAARLKAIEDGQLDELITAAIEAWFEENQPAIIQAIQTLQDDLAALDRREQEDVSALDGRLDVIEADNWVTTQKIADEAVTESKLNPAIIRKITDGLTLNKMTIDPILHGTIAYPAPDDYHVGGICEFENMQFVAASKRNQPDNDGMITTVSIQTDDVLTSAIEEIGKGNSLCYNSNTDRVYLAPAQDIVTGIADYLNVYTIDVVNHVLVFEKKLYTAGIWMRGVSFDPITKKMYAVEGDDIYLFDEDTETFSVVKTVENLSTFDQDIAVWNDYYFLGDSGYHMYILGNLNNDDYQIGEIAICDLHKNFYMQEFCAAEFVEDGTLLMTLDATFDYEATCFVCSYPMFSDGTYSRQSKVINWSKITFNQLQLNYTSTKLSFFCKNLCEVNCFMPAVSEGFYLLLQSDVDLKNTGVNYFHIPNWVKVVYCNNKTLDFTGSQLILTSDCIRFYNGTLKMLNINSMTLQRLQLETMTIVSTNNVYNNPAIGSMIAINASTASNITAPNLMGGCAVNGQGMYMYGAGKIHP